MKKPFWNGKYVDPSCLNKAVFPQFATGWPIFQVGGCHDFFFIVFSTIEKLEAGIEELCKLRGETEYKIKQVEEPTDFMASIKEHAVRIMCDPVFHESGRVRWTEIIYDGEQWSLLDAERN